MEVYEDLVKLVNTARGKEKMFGYKSQLANRLYLTYFFAGKFYTDETVHRLTKFTFIIATWLSIFTSLGFITGSYIIYGDKKDFQLLMSVAYSTFITLLTYIVEPLLAAYFYGENLMRAIEMADEFIMKRINREKIQGLMDAEHLTGAIITVELVMGIGFFFYTPTIMLLFYEDEKAKDYNYYITYIPKIDEWGSMTYFYVVTMSLGVVALPIYMYLISMTCLVQIFSCICHNEAQYIADDLNLISYDIATKEQYEQEIEPRFRTTITKCVRDYAELKKLLENCKGYYTTLAGILILGLFLVELSHAINIVLPGTSPTVRVKEILAFFVTILPVVVYCWAGNIFKEMAHTVSFAVYSLPWYWSTTHRKDVYILLCQAQVSTDQFAWSVYPLELRTILRFLNTIQSTINVLRAVILN